MVVVIANDLPPAIRGRMKLWFVEARPNVFVSGISNSAADNVVQYLVLNSPTAAGMIIVHSIPRPPGYRITTVGAPATGLLSVSGLQLIKEFQR